MTRADRCVHDLPRGQCGICSRSAPGAIPLEGSTPTGSRVHEDRRLRARFPSADFVSEARIIALRALAAEDRYPHYAHRHVEFRRRFADLFTPEGLWRMTAEDFVEFYRGTAIAYVGNASLVADFYADRWGLEEYWEQARAAIEYLLFDEMRSLEQRLTDLIDGRRSPAVPGIKETILTKVLAAAMPDRIFPLLVYDSKSGKRQIAKAVFDLSLPKRDRTSWTIGRLVIWSNDLFLDIGRRLEFADPPSEGEFIWWAWTQQRDGTNPLRLGSTEGG